MTGQEEEALIAPSTSIGGMTRSAPVAVGGGDVVRACHAKHRIRCLPIRR
jgi:hypothetical protein